MTHKPGPAPGNPFAGSHTLVAGAVTGAAGWGKPPANAPAGPLPAAGSALRRLRLDADGLAMLRRVWMPATPQDPAALDPRAGRSIALIDPTGTASAALMRMLARAGGQAMQHVALHADERTPALAWVSRCTLPRPAQPPLHVLAFAANGPFDAARHAAEAVAAGAALTVLLAGQLPAAALAALAHRLAAAAFSSEWRCPCVLTVLPQGRGSAMQTLLQAPWPPTVQHAVLVEGADEALPLWNRVMAHWRQAMAPRHASAAPAQQAPAAAAAIRSGHATAAEDRLGAAMPLSAPDLQPLLQRLAKLNGVLACALVDPTAARSLAQVYGPSAKATQPLDAWVSAMCQAHAAQAQALGMRQGAENAPDELLLTRGRHQALLRQLPGPRPWAILALLERREVNLPLLRFSLLPIEQQLANPGVG